METKTLDNTNGAEAAKAVSDIKFYGNPDTWVLLSKASSELEGWMKSTKVLFVSNAGCLVQVTTQQGEHVAEAVAWCPGVYLGKGKDGLPQLVSMR